jgi:alpha-beta hydrolase superfamily lysophospholipase
MAHAHPAALGRCRSLCAAFAAAAPSGVLDRHCFAGLSHEIFNEPEKAEVQALLAAWLRRF